MNKHQNGTVEVSVNEKDLREGIMPRAQLSKTACEIALEKTSTKNVKQFAGWELMEELTGKQEIGHVSNLALFAFTEHVGLCENIIAGL